MTQYLAAALRARAAEGQVTQTQIAQVTGISQSQVSKLLRGRRVLDIDELDAICHVLGLDIGEVLTIAAHKASRHADQLALPSLVDADGLPVNDPS